MKVSAHSRDGFQVEIDAAGHTLIADEHPDDGPTSGPNPYAFLLSSLAACKIMTVKLYAERKGWPPPEVRVELSIQKVYARDCEDCESDPNARVDVIEQSLHIEGAYSPDQLDRMLAIADKCPVHRTLTTETIIRSV